VEISFLGTQTILFETSFVLLFTVNGRLEVRVAWNSPLFEIVCCMVVFQPRIVFVILWSPMATFSPFRIRAIRTRIVGDPMDGKTSFFVPTDGFSPSVSLVAVHAERPPVTTIPEAIRNFRLSNEIWLGLVIFISIYSVSLVHYLKGGNFMNYESNLTSVTTMGVTGIIVGIVAFVGIALLFAMFCIVIFNALVGLRNRVKNSYAQIDVQLKRRYDLIPNLVETAKGYMKHESETLEAVIQARNQAVSAASAASKNPTGSGVIKDLAGADGALTGALGKLMVVMEAYPDLKASENMLQVQEELTSTENRVAFSRQAYNDTVMGYNTKREQFPSNIIAGMFGFIVAQSWELDDEAARDAPKVSF